MVLTKKEIEHIARLARLELTEEEKEKFANQLSSVLDYVSQLQKVDTSGVSYTYHVEGLENVADADVVSQSDTQTRNALLQEMPDRVGDFLKVKSVF